MNYTPLFTQNALPEEIAKTCIQYAENNPTEFIQNLEQIGWIVYLVLDQKNSKKELELVGFAQAIDKAVVPGMDIDVLNDNTRKVQTIAKVASFLKKTDCSFEGFGSSGRALFGAALLAYQEDEYPRLLTTIAKKGLVTSILQDDSITNKVLALQEADSIAYQIAKSNGMEDAMRLVDSMTGEELYRQYSLVKKQQAISNSTNKHGSYTLK